jgi:hypothetical protein
VEKTIEAIPNGRVMMDEQPQRTVARIAQTK